MPSKNAHHNAIFLPLPKDTSSALDNWTEEKEHS